MPGDLRQIDESVKDSLLRYPTVELIRRIFPDVRMRGRSVMCNPLRGEHNPSLSCFRDRAGISRWKDFATGETGDNIDFFRLAYPELDYAEAVDRLSTMLLGRSAFADGVSPVRREPLRQVRAAYASPEPAYALEIVSDVPFFAPGTPEALIAYSRSRGISDEVLGRYCRSVVFVNTNIRGRMETDPGTGLPLLGRDGRPILCDGRSEAVAIPNDAGGYSLRVPEAGGRRGFKGCDRAFFSTILADGSFPSRNVRFFGEGDNVVRGFVYDAASCVVQVNPTQGFAGVSPWAAHFARPFIGTWDGRRLEGRDLRAAVAVLDGLNGPVNTVATVVEGMFDALSVIEFRRLNGRGSHPGTDLVVLNSLTNLSWAVPFLAMHREVRSLLDNDMRSSAGQKAFSVLREEVSSYSERCGRGCVVRSDSSLFAPHKDMNEYLQAVLRGEAGEKKKTGRSLRPSSPSRRPGKGPVKTL